MHCPRLPLAHAPQVRQVVLHAGEATGPCKARALAQRLWDGEEFYLQVWADWAAFNPFLIRV